MLVSIDGALTWHKVSEVRVQPNTVVLVDGVEATMTLMISDEGLIVDCWAVGGDEPIISTSCDNWDSIAARTQ